MINIIRKKNYFKNHVIYTFFCGIYNYYIRKWFEFYTTSKENIRKEITINLNEFIYITK